MSGSFCGHQLVWIQAIFFQQLWVLCAVIEGYHSTMGGTDWIEQALYIKDTVYPDMSSE